MILGWMMDKEVSRCVSVGPAQHHQHSSQPRVGHGEVEGLLAELKAGTIHLGCRGSQSFTGGLVALG